MRETTIEFLRCPRCRAEASLALTEDERDDREIREGALSCRSCGGESRITRGVVDLLFDPPDFVVREANGLARFAETMRADGWDKTRVLALPNDESGYWYTQRASIDQLLETVALSRGQRLLDIGSNTCWASNIFAEHGLDVTALDISLAEMQGLQTADWFFEANDVYFERVLGTMFDLPFAAESFDFVFCCEVLHHNDKRTLSRTFREVHRVLKPDGLLLIINEQMKFPLELKRDHACDVAQYEGYEHVHFFHRYYLGARRAGFADIRVLEPPYHHFFRGDRYTLAPDTPVVNSLKISSLQLLRKSRLGRNAYLAYRTLIGGDVSLNMICKKSS
jgi:SAM-dependent methyltransferase/uncharacterized protein YbaR (Trm112 family)